MSCLSSFVKKKPTVSVIVLEGEIGRKKALSLKKTKKMINKAFEKPNLVAVAMVINSGGGSPVQSQLIASYLLDRFFLCILVLMSSLKSSSSQTKPNNENIYHMSYDHLCSGATPLEFPSLPLPRIALVMIQLLTNYRPGLDHLYLCLSQS